MMSIELQTLLEKSLLARYPHDSEECKNIRNAVIECCVKYLSSGLGDNNAERKLTSNDNSTYWQQLSEVLLAEQLEKADVKFSHPADAPDFLIEQGGRKIWVEVITPEPKGLPGEWLEAGYRGCISVPHPEILLRWTSAIKEKVDKLRGYTCRKTGGIVNGYIEKGVVDPNKDAYVIAVNGRLLRRFGDGIPMLDGISQFPFAVEATLCVGPMQVRFDRGTLKVVGAEHQTRICIPKSNGATVPVDTFLDPKFSPVSAIWAVDLDEMVLLGHERPMAVVHNPNASQPIPRNFLPSQFEYVATDEGENYALSTHVGSMDGKEN